MVRVLYHTGKDGQGLYDTINALLRVADVRYKLVAKVNCPLLGYKKEVREEENEKNTML